MSKRGCCGIQGVVIKKGTGPEHNPVAFNCSDPMAKAIFGFPQFETNRLWWLRLWLRTYTDSACCIACILLCFGWSGWHFAASNCLCSCCQELLLLGPQKMPGIAENDIGWYRHLRCCMTHDASQSHTKHGKQVRTARIGAWCHCSGTAESAPGIKW